MTDLMPFALCLLVALPLIWIAPHLDGENTREIERAAEAREWLIAMGVVK